MSQQIDFYFDFSSPYGYLASERIEGIASRQGHLVIWHPILLGAVFRVTGQGPLTEIPVKGGYAIRDFQRSAREHDLIYSHPEVFPVGAVSACRATLWLRDHQDPSVQAKTGQFVHAVYRAYFAQGQDITQASVIAELADSLQLDSQALLTALANQVLKDALRREVDQAIDRGVFGSPMMFIGDEPFWGHDRLEQLERWISSGGW
ncbi:MAG: 2-hydroxychromene-2-carboxylate isomerase [Granulosicoccus sp.]|nr:2-hydroxychromene-2-carboxylate isomerase [Granulosicoccus sp.]